MDEQIERAKIYRLLHLYLQRCFDCTTPTASTTNWADNGETYNRNSQTDRTW